MSFEHIELQKELPMISYNCTAPGKDRWLWALESGTMMPANYSDAVIGQYKGIITWNSKFYEDNKDRLNIKLLLGFPLFNRKRIDQHVKYEDKIEGVCLMTRHRPQGLAGQRLVSLTAIAEAEKGLVCHTYGKLSYGGSMYQGQLGEGPVDSVPSSAAKIKLLSSYKFNHCFENEHHEYWSWGYITEKLFDAFRAKTVAIYYGCWNIEDIVPKECYVDYRDFADDADLAKYLKNMPKKEYEGIVEAATAFDDSTTYGDFETQREALRKLIKTGDF